MRGREYFQKYKKVIKFSLRTISLLPRKTRERLFVSFRYKNGYSGLLLRYLLFASLAKKCGDNVTIHQGCYFYNLDKIEVGDNVAFNQMCYIQGAGGLKIGDNVGLAHGVTIESETHNYNNLTECIANQGLDLKTTIIDDDVWVGTKATILYGKHLGKGSIVGANSVVTKDIDVNAIVGGVPAKLIKYRGE